MQKQDAPGLQSRMDPVPDCGETSYTGHERLKGRRALITGGDSGIGRPSPSLSHAKAPRWRSTTSTKSSRTPIRSQAF